MLQITIAGVRCCLVPEAGEFVFGPNLFPFQADHAAADLTLRLSLVPGWQAEHLDLPSHHVDFDAGHFEFYRPGGCLTATDDFRCCHARIDSAVSHAFSGQPWLMLALWGYLTHRNGLFLHGACCEIEGKRVLLLGPQQVGKSTLGRLVVESDGACLTDEYPFVTSEEGRFLAHGTPWPRVRGPVTAVSGPLDAIYFLRHAPANELLRLDVKEAARRLLANNRFFTWSPATVPLGAALIDGLVRKVPVYDYGFVPTVAAVAPLVESP